MIMNTEQTHQQLSALIDDELGYHESLSLSVKLQEDADCRRKLHRFEVAKALMSNGNMAPVIPDMCFADRVQKALEDEPVVLSPRSMGRKTKERLSTYAIAASLTAVALLAGQSLFQYSPGKANEILAKVELASPSMQASMDPELRDYVILHNESTYLSGVQGMMPSIRLVSGSSSR